MLQLGHVVGADEEHPAAVRAEPLASPSVYGYRADAYAVEKIVGIVGPVVARHLHLGECLAAVGYVCRREHERSGSCPEPYVALDVLLQASHSLCGESRSVLIDEACVHLHPVGGRLVAYQGGLAPVAAAEPHQSATVEHESHHVFH